MRGIAIIDIKDDDMFNLIEVEQLKNKDFILNFYSDEGDTFHVYLNKQEANELSKRLTEGA